MFKSKEEKEELKRKKEEEKLMKVLEKYNLEKINPEYADSVRDIQLELMGTGLIDFGSFFSGRNSEDTLKIAYLKTLMEQNWIMIRQLDEISKKLDK